MPSEQAIEAAAKAAHEVNRAYRGMIGQDPGLPWERLPLHVVETVRNGVRLIIENPTTGPELLHQQWLDNMRAGGWTFGPVDSTAKTHPGLVPWEHLPPWERAKDQIFGTVVRAVLEALQGRAMSLIPPRGSLI